MSLPKYKVLFAVYFSTNQPTNQPMLLFQEQAHNTEIDRETEETAEIAKKI